MWVAEPDDQPQSREPAPSTRYVSAETTGYDTLDRYGRWDTLPNSEPVWFPTSVPDDWAPYRFGHWDSIPPWGWTWIDDQPWGFAPFHYGRWINVDGHWGWVPGAVVSHPVYAPALVAFIDTSDDPGGGPDGGPGVGWFPLGPGDDYTPWYDAGPGYIDGVNRGFHGHFHDFGPHGYGARDREAWRAQYFNRRFATVVSREAFADAHRIGRAIMRMPEDRLDHAGVMRGAPRVMPAAARTLAPPGEFHGGLHGATPASAATGGLRNRLDAANQAAEHQDGAGHMERAVGRGGPTVAGQPGRGGERPGQGSGRSEIGYRPAQAERAGAQQFGQSELARNPTLGYRGSTEQFGRPMVSQGLRGGAQQFGQPQVSQAFRGGGGQFGRPQVFQTPAASYRGGGLMGRAAVPQMAARPAAVHFSGAAVGGGRHK